MKLRRAVGYAAEVVIKQQGNDLKEHGRVRYNPETRLGDGTTVVASFIEVEPDCPIEISCYLKFPPIEVQIDLCIDGVLRGSQTLKYSETDASLVRTATFNEAYCSFMSPKDYDTAPSASSDGNQSRIVTVPIVISKRCLENYEEMKDPEIDGFIDVYISAADGEGSTHQGIGTCSTFATNENSIIYKKASRDCLGFNPNYRAIDYSRWASEASALSELALQKTRPGPSAWANFVFLYKGPHEEALVELPGGPSRSLRTQQRQSRSMPTATAMPHVESPTTIKDPSTTKSPRAKSLTTMNEPSATAAPLTERSTMITEPSATAITRAEPPVMINMPNITAHPSTKRPGSPSSQMVTPSKCPKMDLKALRAELQQAEDLITEANRERDAAAALVNCKKASFKEANDKYQKEVQSLQEKIQDVKRQAQGAKEEKEKLETEAKKIEKETSLLVEEDD